MKILTFETQEAAQICLDAINALAAEYWVAQNRTVIDGPPKQLVSINARTGRDDQNAPKMTSWANIKEQNGVFWFNALSNDPRFVDGMETLPAETYGWTEIDLPEDWITGDEFE